MYLKFYLSFCALHSTSKQERFSDHSWYYASSRVAYCSPFSTSFASKVLDVPELCTHQGNFFRLKKTLSMLVKEIFCVLLVLFQCGKSFHTTLVLRFRPLFNEEDLSLTILRIPFLWFSYFFYIIPSRSETPRQEVVSQAAGRFPMRPVRWPGLIEGGVGSFSKYLSNL
jgi:hypothetical protein